MAPIRSVAVIGAGISGVSSAAHILRHGLEVVVFERSSVAGGVWHFDPRPDRDPEYPGETSPDVPNGASSGADYDLQHKLDKNPAEDIALSHAPPGPCYEGLMNNVPTTLMRSTLLPWPEGTPDHVTHHEIELYVQRLAHETGAHDVTLYNTRVEEAVKNGDNWALRTKTLQGSNTQGFTVEEKQWSFDAVVVGAGHYHVPLLPNVPGLAEWKRKYPRNVMHSKSYRYPTAFKDQNVLIIGAGVSSLDIAKELEGLADKVYQSSRGGIFDLDPSFLPANSQRVSGLQAFKLDEGTDINGAETPDSPISGTVHLTDGRILSDIHHVIVATGYQTTYPFLTGLESDTIPVDDADEKIIITADKCVTHNLYKDIFYIPDPSLTFVGVPYYTSTFSLFDFQAEVVARVYAGLANLPSEEEMQAEHTRRKAKGEKGKAFHSLISNQVGYMDEVLSWVNDGVEEYGIDRMRGVDDAWYRAYEDFKANSRKLIPPGSDQIQQPIASKYYQPGR